MFELEATYEMIRGARVTNPLYTEPVPGAELVVGMRYVGDVTCYDLDGMEFVVESISGPEFDMSDGSEFYEVSVTVGAELWDVLIPADATFRRVAPEEN